MKIRAVIFAFVLSILAIAGMAFANTGLQTTPYSNSYFSATFNGPVTADAPTRNTNGTSTDYTYYSISTDGTVGQMVIVRTIDHDISVDLSSSEFYANDDRTPGPITNRSTGDYQGHPLSYTRREETDITPSVSKRTRFIIVNSREVIFVIQIAPFVDYTVPGNTTAAGVGDQTQWFAFEDSLQIR